MPEAWFGSDALDALLTEVATATTVRLLDDYTLADDFATVNSRTIAQVTISGADFALPPVNGGAANSRRLVFNGKSATASSDSSVGNLHIALCDASHVLAVTDETSDQPITTGNTVNFPSFYMEAQQPVLA